VCNEIQAGHLRVSRKERTMSARSSSGSHNCALGARGQRKMPFPTRGVILCSLSAHQNLANISTAAGKHKTFAPHMCDIQ